MGDSKGRYTVVGDPHVKPNNLDYFKELTQMVEELNNPCIWLGDLLDTKEVIRGKCLNAWVDYFRSSKLNHVVIVGNHDWFNLECEDHSLRVLENMDNVTVVDSPKILSGIAFIPYIHDQDKLKEALKKVSDCETGILFGHLEVSSFDYGNGFFCDNGLSLKELRNFKLVVSGHFHKYQNKDNLVYLGTPFSHSFGESNQHKYIAELTDRGDLQLIPTNFPQHVTVEFNCNLLNDKLENSVIPGLFEGKDISRNHYRVVLKGSQENIDRFPRHMYQKLDIKWIEKPSDLGKELTSISETLSNEAMFKEWATKIAGLDDSTMELGIQILGAQNG